MNARKLTQKSLEAIQSAQNIAIENQNIQIMPEHLLYALLDQDGGLIPQLFKKWEKTWMPCFPISINLYQKFLPSPGPEDSPIPFTSLRFATGSSPLQKNSPTA